MADTLLDLASHTTQSVLNLGHNRFTLTINGLISAISVSSIEGKAELNHPWHYHPF